LANTLIAKNYALVKECYEYKLTAQFLSLLPDTILSQEKLTYSSREELEEEAKEQLKKNLNEKLQNKQQKACRSLLKSWIRQKEPC